MLWPNSQKQNVHGAGDENPPERNREEVRAKAAASKLARVHDASQAMEDLMAEKTATLAKTARLRAARLAIQPLPPKARLE